MVGTNSLLSVLIISKHFLLPPDISYTIYSIIINTAVKTIIDAWYNHIMIHNMNLCYIVTNLQKFIDYDPFGRPFYYYNLYDKNIGITFNICSKYIDLNISSFNWWITHINYAFNCLSFNINYNDPIFKYNYVSICNFYNKIYS